MFFKGVEDYYGGDQIDVEELRKAYKKRGWKGLWQKRIEQMGKDPVQKKYMAWDFLFCHLRAGNREKAFDYLEQSVKDRDRWIITIKYDSSFDSFRNDQRFERIVKEIGND